MKNQCPHCEPYDIDSRHIAERINACIEPCMWLMSTTEYLMRLYPPFFVMANKIAMLISIHIPTCLNFIKPTTAQPDDINLYNRTYVIIKEAAKRGIPIYPLRIRRRTSNYFAMRLGNQTIYFEGLPHLRVDSHINHTLDDKNHFKKILRTHNITHPEGKICRSYAQALRYIHAHTGFPIVIKPKDGSLSKHTTCNIKNETKLKNAIDIARIISNTFIVEQHIDGDVFRATLVNNRLIAICKREAAHVIGDGRHSIAQLIDIKNNHPWRGKTNQKNTTLHVIPITHTTHSLLDRQNVQFTDIPNVGTKIYLQEKITLAAGADIHDVTDIVHPDIKRILEQTAVVCNIDIIGIDFICRDITRAPTTQPFGIIEANTMPYIDMHHYPTYGQPRNVAGAIMDHILAQHKKM